MESVINNESALTKKCSKCMKLKSLEEFYFRKKDKRYENVCKECLKNYKKEHYMKNKKEILQKQKEYYLKNKEQKLEYINQYNQQNKDKIKKYKAKYYEENKDIFSNKGKDYYKQNRDKIIKKTQEYFKNNKEEIYIKRSERLKSDDLYAYKTRTRKFISNAFYNKNFKSFKKLERIVGCSYSIFLEHLYQSFKNNYGISYNEYDGKTNIDHIIPLNEAKDIETVDKLNNYKNLQILKIEDNRKKGIKLDYEI